MDVLIKLDQAVSTHSRLKAAGGYDRAFDWAQYVSTHSRLKAAGCLHRVYPIIPACFNTQPPEGGWANLE